MVLKMKKTSNTKELLEKRRQLKKKKPLFRRKEIYRKKRLAVKWRRARGLDNKQRLHKRGAPLWINIGYKSPAAVRGLHKSGLIPVVVYNIHQLASLSKEQGIIISAKVGNKKRQALISEAQKKGLVLLNLDAEKTIEKIQTELKQRQEERRNRMLEEKDKEKKKSIEEKVKKEEPKKEESAEDKKEEISDEEKKKLEKEEKDRLLIKRE